MLASELVPTPLREGIAVQTLRESMKPTSQLRSRHRRGVIIDVKQRASFPLAVVGQAAFLLEPVVQRGIGKRRAISSDSSANSTNGRARRRQAWVDDASYHAAYPPKRSHLHPELPRRVRRRRYELYPSSQLARWKKSPYAAPLRTPSRIPVHAAQRLSVSIMQTP